MPKHAFTTESTPQLTMNGGKVFWLPLFGFKRGRRLVSAPFPTCTHRAGGDTDFPFNMIYWAFFQAKALMQRSYWINIYFRGPVSLWDSSSISSPPLPTFPKAAQVSYVIPFHSKNREWLTCVFGGAWSFSLLFPFYDKPSQIYSPRCN